MREVLSREAIDILILDVMMPGEDGLSIARSLSNKQDVGIIMVSALGSEPDRIVGLEVGADDYLAKPVSPRELLARLRALQRRRQPNTKRLKGTITYIFDGWQLNPMQRTLRDPEGSITGLAPGEFSLLLAFVERSQQVLTRDQLLDYSRGPQSDSFDRAIDSQISRLRRKIGTEIGGEIIRTVRNEGYIFLPEVTRHA